MSDGVTVTINLPDFRRQLRELGERVEKRVVRNATRAAARVFRDAARAAAPVLSEPDPRRVAGALRRAIYAGPSKIRRGRGVVASYVGVKASRTARKTARDPFYWRFLEAGWIPRGPGQRIQGGTRRKALERSRLAGRRVAVPFLAPAFRRVQGAALAAFNARVESELAAIALASSGLSTSDIA
jgi:HK97 gp10 family phage protein